MAGTAFRALDKLKTLYCVHFFFKSADSMALWTQRCLEMLSLPTFRERPIFLRGRKHWQGQHLVASANAPSARNAAPANVSWMCAFASSHKTLAGTAFGEVDRRKRPYCLHSSTAKCTHYSILGPAPPQPLPQGALSQALGPADLKLADHSLALEEIYRTLQRKRCLGEKY